MKQQTRPNRRIFIALAAATLLSAQVGPLSRASTRPRVSAECEGDACGQVTVTFDEAKQQYRAQNNSTDRWVKVSASNLAAAAGACLAPAAAEYLPLKSIVAPYRAEFAEPRCGAPDSYDAPPAGE
jgi:hypothetical protein